MGVKNLWEFLLEGGSYSLLDSMSSFSNSIYFRVYEELDFMNDCSVQDYRFTSVYCDDESDSDTVWQIGYELVSLFNGANRLLDKDFRKIRIDQLWLNGNRQKFCENYRICGLLGKPYDPDNVVSAEFQRSQPDITFKLLIKATEDEGFYLLLKYFDMEQNWATYYKILETVEELSKKKGQKLYVASGERKRFTDAANNYSLTGIHSRHGFKEQIKKRKKTPMVLDEAHDFIRDLAKRYVQTFL